MDFRWTPEQEALRDKARGVAAGRESEVDRTKLIPLDLTKYYQAPAANLDGYGRGTWRKAQRNSVTLGNIPLEIGGVIILMFVLGFAMEGHLYRPDPNEWLTWFFSFLDAGMGLPYLVLVLADWGVQITPEQAAKVTFEYGNTFLCVAGALNMLAAMDAYDIGVGRKS